MSGTSTGGTSATSGAPGSGGTSATGTSATSTTSGARSTSGTVSSGFPAGLEHALRSTSRAARTGRLDMGPPQVSHTAGKLPAWLPTVKANGRKSFAHYSVASSYRSWDHHRGPSQGRTESLPDLRRVAMGTIPKWALVADSTLPRGTSREAVVTVSPVRAAGAAPPADRAVSTGPGQGRGARPWRILPWLVPILLSGACSPWSPSEVGDPPVYSNAFQPIMAGPPSSSVKVGAYYFGMFGPQWTDSVWGHSLWSQNIYGEDGTDDWWLGVRDLHERRPIKLEPTPPWMQEIWEADWGHLKPAIGYYDQSDVSTVERHIQQARENGLSYFSFYWYWSYAKPGEIWNDGLDSFLLASNADDMEFMINVCEHGWFLSIPAVQIEQVVQTLVGRYLVRPNYLTTAGGRPIIGICDGIGIWNMPTKPAPGSDNPPATQDVATLGLFLAHLREETAAATGVDPLVVFRPDGTKLWTKEASPLADGWNCLAPILHNEPKQTGAPHVHDYPENGKLLPGYLSYVADHPDPGKPLMPCLAQNFDERPRMGILISAPEEIDVMSGYSAEEFRVQLTTLRGWIDARDDEFSHLLTLYAWNEWHEGGILEPSARDGAALLGIVNEVFGLPQGSHPCRTTGLCPGESTTLLDHVDDSPIGNLDGVWPEGLAVGWAIDPDAPGSAVSMHFYLDGPYGTGAWLGMASANLPRPDVNAATGLSGDHGFSFVLPATAKDGNPHTLYAYAINIGSSAEHSVATQEFVLDAAGDPPPDDPGEPEPDSGDNPPIGNLEGVWPEGLAVGWALDPDSLLTSIDMHFYLDGPYGAGVSLGMASANLPRPDKNAVTGLPGDHGFAFVLPAIAKDGDPHTLYAYAINVGSSAEHALFTLSFSLEAEDGGGGDPEPAPENPDGIDDSPIGNLEGVWPEGLAVGWAIDPDSLLTSIDMHFYLDGPYGAGVSLGMASANLPRPDVNAVTGLPGDHGFSFVLPAIVKDGYPHTLYAY
ncbi:MAG: hypothetical protein FJ109_16040, partial [Deltaproteobacteria bacterium]|nr:hypothetical protein [Deltaproteobacteria bacterium]